MRLQLDLLRQHTGTEAEQSRKRYFSLVRIEQRWPQAELVKRTNGPLSKRWIFNPEHRYLEKISNDPRFWWRFYRLGGNEYQESERGYSGSINQVQYNGSMMNYYHLFDLNKNLIELINIQ